MKSNYNRAKGFSAGLGGGEGSRRLGSRDRELGKRTASHVPHSQLVRYIANPQSVGLLYVER